MELAAFIVALLALVVGMLALGWQIAAWVLDGRRVQAVLRYGARVMGGVVVGPVDRLGKPLDLTDASVPGGLGDEVIGVQLSNLSRTSRVRVESFAARVDSGAAFDPQGTAIGESLPCWLEAGETKSWYMEARTARRLVEVSRQMNPKTDRVFMTVSLSPGRTVRARGFLHVE